MRIERYIGAILATFCFPGFGQGLVGRRAWMIALVVVDAAAFALALWSVWFLPIGLLVRLGAAIDAAHSLRQPHASWNRTLPAIAVVAGAISIGCVKHETAAFMVPTSSMYPTIEIGDRVLIDKLSFALREPRRGELIAFYHPCEPARVYIKRVVALAGDTVEVRCNVLFINGTAVSDTAIDGACRYDDSDGVGKTNSRACSRYHQTLDGIDFDTFHDPGRPVRSAAPDTHDFPELDGVRRPPSCALQMNGEPMRATGQSTGTLVETPPTTACAPRFHYVVPDASLFTMGDNRANSNDSRHWGAVPMQNLIGRVIGNWWPLARFGTVH